MRCHSTIQPSAEVKDRRVAVNITHPRRGEQVVTVCRDTAVGLLNSTGATESAISVLRIGDILWAKQDAQTPDWQSELNQDED